MLFQIVCSAKLHLISKQIFFRVLTWRNHFAPQWFNSNVKWCVLRKMFWIATNSGALLVYLWTGRGTHLWYEQVPAAMRVWAFVFVLIGTERDGNNLCSLCGLCDMLSHFGNVIGRDEGTYTAAGSPTGKESQSSIVYNRRKEHPCHTEVSSVRNLA